MKARASHTGQIIVKTSKTLQGVGVKFRGVASNGENSYMLTANAYDKIADQCVWSN
jgi:hypothetical protein